MLQLHYLLAISDTGNVQIAKKLTLKEFIIRLVVAGKLFRRSARLQVLEGKGAGLDGRCRICERSGIRLGKGIRVGGGSGGVGGGISRICVVGVLVC